MTDQSFICVFDPSAVTPEPPLPPEPEPAPPTIDDYRRAIQAHIDAVASQRGYDSGLTCTSYTISTVPAWVAEATAFVAWRDEIWVFAHAELDKAEAGEREQPSIPEIIAELPLLVWPE